MDSSTLVPAGNGVFLDDLDKNVAPQARTLPLERTLTADCGEPHRSGIYEGQVTGRMRFAWKTSIGMWWVLNTRPMSSLSVGS